MRRINAKSRHRTPVVKFKGNNGLLTVSAALMLTEGGTNFVCVGRDPKTSEVFLMPLKVPDGAISISRVHIFKRGQPRIHSAALKEEGTFQLVWDDVAEVAKLVRQEASAA